MANYGETAPKASACQTVAMHPARAHDRVREGG
jgi:hypothetical protein